MDNQYWNYIVTFVGLLGFYLAGKKVWWCWYVNILNQVLWFAYGWVTGQWGFVVGTFFYTFVFVKNAYSWTREHKRKSSPSRRFVDGMNKAFGEGIQRPTVSFHFDGSQFNEAVLLTRSAIKDIEEKFQYGPKRWRWLPLWLRKRIFKMRMKVGTSGETVGKVTHMEMRDGGLYATSTIDTSTPEGQRAWAMISDPGPFSVAANQRRTDALAGYGLSSLPCQSFIFFQGRQIDCEINEHPHGLDHQAVLNDMLPPVMFSWETDGQITVEEL